MRPDTPYRVLHGLGSFRRVKRDVNEIRTIPCTTRHNIHQSKKKGLQAKKQSNLNISNSFNPILAGTLEYANTAERDALNRLAIKLGYWSEVCKTNPSTDRWNRTPHRPPGFPHFKLKLKARSGHYVWKVISIMMLTFGCENGYGVLPEWLASKIGLTLKAKTNTHTCPQNSLEDQLNAELTTYWPL